MGWPDALPFHPVFDYSYGGIMRSFEDSLERLGLERIDMLFVHGIGAVTHGPEYKRHFKDLQHGGHRALNELRHSGQVKAIGLGVNETQACLDALEIGEWDVFLLAGRCTLLEQDALQKLLPTCVAKEISIVIGGPFNSGILVGGDTWNYATAPADVLEKVEQLSGVCREYGIPLPAATLQIPLGHQAVCSAIPGLRTQKELSDTLGWIACDIPPEF